MRLSASRIRSINRAIARVQSSAWSAPDRNHRHSTRQPDTCCLRERGQIREDRRGPKERSSCSACNRNRRANMQD